MRQYQQTWMDDAAKEAVRFSQEVEQRRVASRAVLKDALDGLHKEIEQLQQEELSSHQSQLMAAQERLRQRRRSDLAKRLLESHRMQIIQERRLELEESKKSKVANFKKRMQAAAERALKEEGVTIERLYQGLSSALGTDTHLNVDDESSDDDESVQTSQQQAQASVYAGLRVRSTFEEQLSSEQRLMGNHLSALRLLHAKQNPRPGILPPLESKGSSKSLLLAVDLPELHRRTPAEVPVVATQSSADTPAAIEHRKVAEELKRLLLEDRESIDFLLTKRLDVAVAPRPLVHVPVEVTAQLKLKQLEAKEREERALADVQTTGNVPFEDQKQGDVIIMENAEANATAQRVAHERERETPFGAYSDHPKRNVDRQRVSIADGVFHDNTPQDDALPDRSRSSIIAQQKSDQEAFQQSRQHQKFMTNLGSQKAHLKSLRSRLEQLIADQCKYEEHPISAVTEALTPNAIEVVDATEGSVERDPPPPSSDPLSIAPVVNVNPTATASVTDDDAFTPTKTELTADPAAYPPELMPDEAAVTIQCASRRFLARKDVTNRQAVRRAEINAAALEAIAAEEEEQQQHVDAEIRREAELLELLNEQETLIAMLSREAALVQLQHHAATEIQRIVRGQADRNKISALITARETEIVLSRRRDAAVTLQRWFKCLRERSTLRVRKQLKSKYGTVRGGFSDLAAVAVQNLFRRVIAKRRAAELRHVRTQERDIIQVEAACLIQQHSRRFSLRDAVRRLWTARIIEESLMYADSERQRLLDGM